MKVNFEKMEAQVIPNFKGGDREVIFRTHLDSHNRIMQGTLAPGASIGTHTHEGSSEVIHILRGSGYVLCNGEKEQLSAGDTHYCPEGGTHTLVNDGGNDLVFLGIVPQHHLE